MQVPKLLSICSTSYDDIFSCFSKQDLRHRILVWYTTTSTSLSFCCDLTLTIKRDRILDGVPDNVGHYGKPTLTSSDLLLEHIYLPRPGTRTTRWPTRRRLDRSSAGCSPPHWTRREPKTVKWKHPDRDAQKSLIKSKSSGYSADIHHACNQLTIGSLHTLSFERNSPKPWNTLLYLMKSF